ncbi:MAG: hypothetical protein SFT92_07900 [Rickettsiales bacterium]|nr:hypothetical protein [Rickettsiales bacterium]
MQFAQQISKGRERWFLVRSTQQGQARWHYIIVPDIKVAAFQRALQKGSVDLDDYGEVTFSGAGDEPPEAIQQAVAKHCNA